MVEGKEVVSAVGAVSAGPEESARIGARILEQGGNAMDAAAAACMACCMLRPHATGVGGYVSCGLVLEGATGQTWSLDGNSVSPAAAHEQMYKVGPVRKGHTGINENEYDCSVEDDANVWGPLAIGPPGMMAGMGTLWERWGRLKWADIVKPSLDLLSDGFPFDVVATSVKTHEAVVRKYEATARHLMPEGRLPEPEDIWHRKDMEKTLARVSEAGWRDFYDGEIGWMIADAVLEAGGVMTREDMATYQPRVTRPYGITYRNAEVFASILPNGGLSALQALQMMDFFEPAPQDSLLFWHRWTEVLKRVWRDRLLYLGDPDYVDVPVDLLLSRDYAAGRVESIRQFPDHVDRLVPPQAGGGEDGTMHVSASDVDGNVASMTISQGGAFGSLFVAEATGVILGHGMCRLDPRPGRKNSVASGKRPLNNTAPLMVRLPDRDVGMGLPGGRRLVNANAQMAQRVVDYGATSYEAASAPRLHVQTHEPLLIMPSAGDAVIEGLREMGHEVETGGVAGAAHHAEYLKAGGKARAGGLSWAAGA
jgi:gamma-glutamyltranspeptidase / glutathione hydrolase